MIDKVKQKIFDEYNLGQNLMAVQHEIGKSIKTRNGEGEGLLNLDSSV